VLAVLVHPVPIIQATRCSPCQSWAPPSPLTPPSLPPLTSSFYSFLTLCRWQGTQRWRDPVGTNEIPHVNRCARVFWGVWRKFGRVWRKSVTCIALFCRALSNVPTPLVDLNEQWVGDNIADEEWTWSWRRPGAGLRRILSRRPGGGGGGGWRGGLGAGWGRVDGMGRGGGAGPPTQTLLREGARVHVSTFRSLPVKARIGRGPPGPTRARRRRRPRRRPDSDAESCSRRPGCQWSGTR
jgi:hypothetical protein